MSQFSITDQFKSRAIDWIIGGVIAFLGTILLYMTGVFDTSIKKYILTSMVPTISSGSNGGVTSEKNHQYTSHCERGELIIGGTCLVRHGGGYIQNTLLEPADSPIQFRCVFGNESSDFEGEAHAICLRSR